MKKIIIISAHPDDETLGAGGTLLKHKANGDHIEWLIVTNILESEGFSNQRVQERQNEIEIVAKMFGFSAVHKLDYPTMKLDTGTMLEMIPKIAAIFSQSKPEVIYVMNRSDAHSDHRVIFDAVMACTKSFRYPSIKQVLMYECISETEFAPVLPEKVFQPNYYVDVTSQFAEKIAITKVYASELAVHPFPRSIRNIEALATFRGASAGVEYAEAFQLIKFIDK